MWRWVKRACGVAWGIHVWRESDGALPCHGIGHNPAVNATRNPKWAGPQQLRACVRACVRACMTPKVRCVEFAIVVEADVFFHSFVAFFFPVTRYVVCGMVRCTVTQWRLPQKICFRPVLYPAPATAVVARRCSGRRCLFFLFSYMSWSRYGAVRYPLQNAVC